MNEKRNEWKRNRNAFGILYSPVIIVVYLLWGFVGNGWNISWILPAAGAILYTPLHRAGVFTKKDGGTKD
jgi:hypothetical protein